MQHDNIPILVTKQWESCNKADITNIWRLTCSASDEGRLQSSSHLTRCIGDCAWAGSVLDTAQHSIIVAHPRPRDDTATTDAHET